MKNRPLASICFLFLLIQTILVIQSGQEKCLSASRIFLEKENQKILVTGEVYQKSHTSKVQVLYLKNNSINHSKLIIYDDTFTEVPIGKTISLYGKVSTFDTAHNPGNFDQQMYYAKQDIYASVWCEEIVDISGKTDWLREYLYRFKMKWAEQIQAVMGEENGGILCAMLLADKSDMDPDTKELYQKSGISHVLAISGLHISFIGIGVYQLIRKTGFSYAISGIIGIFILSLYVMMIGFSVSVLRAFIMLLFKIGADMCGRVYDLITALAVAAAITIAYQPLYVQDAGFLLSYGAILGIVGVGPALEKVFPTKKKWLQGWYASIGVNVFLFPILLWFYYEIPLYAFFLNLFVIPLMSWVLGLGMFGSLLGVFWKDGSWILLKGCSILLSTFEIGSQITSRLPLSRIVFGKPSGWSVMLYYMFLGALILGVEKFKKKQSVIAVLYGIVLLCMIYHPNGKLQITMLDVGQGDGIYMEGPTGTDYFIDGGSSDVESVGKYRIEPCLKSFGVGSLDYVFISHGDGDHYSGIKEMLERQEYGVRIKNLVLPVHFRENEALVELAQLAQKYHTNVWTMNAGKVITEGTLRITCIQPEVGEKTLEDNAGSMVLDVRYGAFSMLMTGDVEAEGEEMLTQKLKGKQSYDVLKVAHHGSKNSTSEAFLQVVKPQVAWISAGEENRYGHPHEEVLERLKKIGCNIQRTDESGAITLRID